jgi:starvation-inducible DNA-binding protein
MDARTSSHAGWTGEALLTSPAPTEVADASEWNALLADIFALYLKTSSLRWRSSGPHLANDRHLLSDEASHIAATTDTITRRLRRIASAASGSVWHVCRFLGREDPRDGRFEPKARLLQLLSDNRELVQEMREECGFCEKRGDKPAADALAIQIEQTERFAWLLSEIVEPAPIAL